MSPRYIPALSFRWLTPLYDPLLKWVMHEETFKQKLIQHANIQSNMNVLDLGCGTGTLTIMLKQRVPQASVIGLDGDNEVLNVARSKADHAGMNIQWEQGLAYDLPYPADSFDRVISSLVIHHLVSADKVRTFQEIHRVLRPGGEFHMVDFGPPHNRYERVLALFDRWLEEAEDNALGRLPGMMQSVGLQQVQETFHLTTIFGSLSMLRAIKGV
ncbi:MAG TPA: class I SAM-dependent methyltransferase [Candidatus Paceibacterota bacterium]